MPIDIEDIALQMNPSPFAEYERLKEFCIDHGNTSEEIAEKIANFVYGRHKRRTIDQAETVMKMIKQHGVA